MGGRIDAAAVKGSLRDFGAVFERCAKDLKRAAEECYWRSAGKPVDRVF